MANKRRLQDSFKRAARRSLLVSVVAFSALTGCASSPARSDGPDQNDPHKPVSVTSLQQNLEGRDLTSNTEAIFRRNAPHPVNQNMSEARRVQAYIDQLCFTTDSARKPEQEAMRRALEELYALPLTGRPLVEMAARENIQFCNIKHLPAGTGAQYVPTLGAVLAPGDMPRDPMTLRIAHELLHAVQDQNQLLHYQYSWDVHSRLARNLSIEAAAISFEILVAFEAKQNGDARLWNYLSQSARPGSLNSYGDVRLYTLAEEKWAAAKTSGKDDAAALRDVGQALWQRMFENQPWLDFYLNFELATYIRDVTSGMLDDKRPQSGAYTQDKIDNTGKIGNRPSFTQGARLPSLDRMLAGNTKIRQAYAAVDLERHRRALGNNHAQTRALRRAAEADNNPYIDLDFADALRQMQQNAFPDAEGKKKFAYLHEYMDRARALMGGDTKTAEAPADMTGASLPAKLIEQAIKTPIPPVARNTSDAVPEKTEQTAEGGTGNNRDQNPAAIPVDKPPQPPVDNVEDPDWDAPRPVPPRDTLAKAESPAAKIKITAQKQTAPKTGGMRA